MAGRFSLGRKRRSSASEEDVLTDQDLQLLYTAAKRDDAQSFSKLIKRLSKRENSKVKINLLRTKIVCPPVHLRKPSVFVLAAQFGNAEVVTLLLRNCPERELVEYTAYSTLEDRVHNTGSAIRRHFLLQRVSALNAASSAGHDLVVNILLNAGADIESTDCCGYSPLSNAAANGFCTTVQLLLSRGADVTHTNSQGYTPLHLAAANGHLQVVSMFLENNLLSPFQLTLSTVDRRRREGRGEVFAPFPLFLAAIYRQRAVVSLLLSQPDCELYLMSVSSKILTLSSYLEPLNQLYMDQSNRGFIPPLTALSLKAIGDFPQQFHFLPPLHNDAPMLSCFATKALEHYQQLTSPYSFEAVQHTVSVGCYMYLVSNYEVASVLWLSSLYTHSILMSEKLKRDSCDCTIAHEIARGTHYISRITLLTCRYMKELLARNMMGVVPHFPRYVKYGVQLLEVIASFQYHDVHILGYVQPIQSAVLTLFRLWLCNCDTMHENAPASERWSLGEDFVTLSSELISDITTPIHIALEMSRYSRYHPYLKICDERTELCGLLEGLCQWGGTIFLNQPDCGGRLPIHLAAEVDGFRTAGVSNRIPFVSQTLLSYGAHSDVYRFMSYAHPQLSGISRLTCLSCRTIVKSKIPYELLRIPPRLKTLIRIHDGRTELSTRSRQPRAVHDLAVFVQISNSSSYDQYYRLR